MKIKRDAVLAGILVACAVITTGAVLRREFLAPTTALGQVKQKPVLIPHWRDDLVRGIHFGPEAAPVQLTEFADFECPFCGTFYETLKVIRESYPTQVAVVYVHFPLPMHRFAIPAARAAECGGDQGRFEAMHDALFEGQDQFGLKQWDEYASAARVPDIAAFDVCIKKTDSIPRVEEGKALGAKLDVQGTPTIIINGWKLGRPPTQEELDGMVKRILAGKSPVDGKL
jgi:protein-disulfide isomerase